MTEPERPSRLKNPLRLVGRDGRGFVGGVLGVLMGANLAVLGGWLLVAELNWIVHQLSGPPMPPEGVLTICFISALGGAVAGASVVGTWFARMFDRN